MSEESTSASLEFAEALDIQHDTDPATPESAQHIPHFGHAALFFGIAIAATMLCILIAIVPALVKHGMNVPAVTLLHAGAIGQLLGYGLTFAIAIPVFTGLWRRPFAVGISWTLSQARRYWWQLMLIGITLSVLGQLSEHFVHTPKDSDILKLLDTPLAAWLTAIAGALIAPIVEEIAFRGFLLPAIAFAYDWASLEKTPAARDHWHRTTTHTTAALIFSAIITSIAFAGLHAAQLHHAWGIVGILFVVSLVLCTVRIRLHSVAASSLVHMTYNSLLFLEMIVVTGGFRHLDKLTH
jgi:membrane protease YdiL (CAAX protease family)